MNNLTIIYSTSRHEPEFQWFYDSVRRESDCQIIVIDPACREGSMATFGGSNLRLHPPKPTVWQGPHRVTREDWWAKSNALNTGFCLCRTDWVMCVDDRSVLLPGWFGRVQAAVSGNYAVCGKYEKTHHLQVANGQVISYIEPVDDKGRKTGKDGREGYVLEHWVGRTPADCPGEWWFGCLNALPLEWALAVNGYDETADGISGEDTMFGLHLKNSGYPIKYDLGLALIEDRTPGRTGPVIRREDKGKTPNDKSHALVAKLRHRKGAAHPINLRDIRQVVQQGGPFPPPWGPTHDFYDGQPIREF